jgi:hypothetical protein
MTPSYSSTRPLTLPAGEMQVDIDQVEQQAEAQQAPEQIQLQPHRAPMVGNGRNGAPNQHDPGTALEAPTEGHKTTEHSGRQAKGHTAGRDHQGAKGQVRESQGCEGENQEQQIGQGAADSAWRRRTHQDWKSFQSPSYS